MDMKEQLDEAMETIRGVGGNPVELTDVIRVEVLQYMQDSPSQVTDKQFDRAVDSIVNYIREYVIPDMVSDAKSSAKDEEESDTEGNKDWFCGDCEEAFETPVNADQVYGKACPLCGGHNITYTPDKPD